LGEKLFVVINPSSGKGRGGALKQSVLAAFAAAGGELEHADTRAAGDEARLAKDAIARGFKTIVAVGGDGTWSNVGDAILGAGAKDVALGLVAAGTGCDLAKSFGIPARDVAASARVVRNGRTVHIDVGRIEGRHFLNVAGFGYDIAVIEDSWTVRWLKGDLVYLYCALRQLHRFPGFPVEIEIDGRALGKRELLMLVVANGRIFGGGFRIAPQASLEDGLLDGMAFGNMGLLRRLKILVGLLRGTHAASPDVAASRASRYVFRFAAPPAYEVDGEWTRAKSAELSVEVVPRALALRVPA
jgi:diacylglycerol kinase (ATP)